MLWPLTCDAWAASGRPMPTYTRDRAPGRMIRSTDGPEANGDGSR
jgi:hypothetical protein